LGWRCRWCWGWRCRRRGSRLWSRAARHHCDIRATIEPLHIGCLSIPTRAAVEIPVEAVAVPPLRLDLVPIAAVVLLPDHRVSRPPAPLQHARIAAQVVWNHVTEFVCLRQAPFRWQVEAFWVQVVDRLAVCSGVVRNAIRRRLCTHQRPPGASVADHHLNVTIMVGCDRMLELGGLTAGVSRSDGFLGTTRCAIHAIICPSASGWHPKVAMSMRA